MPAIEAQAASDLSNVTVAEARSNLAIQHRASQVNVAGQLEEQLGGSYASVYFDNATGEFVVPVATAGDGKAATAAGEDAVEEEFSSAGLSSDFRTEVVRYSHPELEAAQEDLSEALAGLAEEVPTQTAIDPEADAVEIEIPFGTPAATQAKIEAAALEAGVHTEVVRLDPEALEATTDACNSSEHLCDLPVRGGVRMWGGPPYLNEGEMVENNCTVGFRANGFDGRKYILTAGHCMTQDEIPNGQPVWTWQTADVPGYWHYLGRSDQWRYPGRDWAKIDATGTWADTPPWPTEVAYWGSTEEYPVVGEARAYVGETLCHVGYVSGTSCGVVYKENVEVEYNVGTPRESKVLGMFKAVGPELNAIEGDSGGPVVANNIALGVLSGSGSLGPEHTWIFFNDITEATAELNVNIAGPGITEAITGSTVGSPTTTSAVVSGQVDPHGMSTEYAFEWGQSSFNHLTTYGEAGSAQAFTAVSKNIEGLEPATTYKYRITATNGLGTATGAEGTFTTAPAPPVVLTEMAEGVTKESAKLWASVNPLGSPTSYQFEYGTSTAYGSVVPASPQSVESGRVSVRVSQKVSGLKSATTYHYRVKASNAAGASYGLDGTFTTPAKPLVTAEAASYVNTLEPTLNATINPERADTHYQFEYGTTESYGTKVPVPAADIGTAGVPSTVENGVKGLARGTTYHYRATAENEVGVVHGADRTFTTLPPCKGAEAKCAWSLQEASNPSPAERFELKGVSCSSATSCVAVGKNLYNGKSFVDRWNGSSWSLFSGTVSGEMKHLSCMAAGCLVAGTAGGAAQTWWVGEITGLSGWALYPMTPPVPTGATETVLKGVSCTGTSACTAVGSYRGSEGVYHPLVERWNGSAWSLQSAPNPAEGTAQNAMLSVSCNSNGCLTVGEAAGKPVAETWIAGTWALSSAKLPAGAKGGRLSSISCNSSICVAVGNSYEVAGQEKAFAESFSGISWSLMSAPSPAEAKGFVELAGVSCPTATSCTAAGYYAPSVSGGLPTEMKTLVEAWNGSSWAIQSSPNAGQKYNLLVDVSCTSATACTGAGVDSPGVGQNPESLAERWNGTTWSTQAVVNPELPIEDELKAVSCSSNTLCVGAGKDLFAEKGFTEVWNGTAWMVASGFAGEMRKISCVAEGCVAVGVKGGAAETWLVVQFGGAWGVIPTTPASPSGATETVLNGVSCANTSACTAVGSYKGSEGSYHPLVERWNGSAWSLQSAPNPAEGSAQNAMLAVGCSGATSCMAVGEAAGKPVAETWNGSAWSLSPAPPTPSGAKGATLVGVSCGSVKVCIAVGDSYEGAGTEKALAERWSGSGWAVVPTPAPSGAKGLVDLTDVSCLSPNACFAAGYYAPEMSGGSPVSLKSLVESWEGTAWSVLTTPNLQSQTYNSLAGISCSTSIDCTAVGGATSSVTKRPPVQLAMRFE